MILTAYHGTTTNTPECKEKIDEVIRFNDLEPLYSEGSIQAVYFCNDPGVAQEYAKGNWEDLWDTDGHPTVLQTEIDFTGKQVARFDASDKYYDLEKNCVVHDPSDDELSDNIMIISLHDDDEPLRFLDENQYAGCIISSYYGNENNDGEFGNNDLDGCNIAVFDRECCTVKAARLRLDGRKETQWINSEELLTKVLAAHHYPAQKLENDQSHTM